MTVTLNKCGRDGCNPVEQTRGAMKPEDHHMQHARYAAAAKFVEDHGVAVSLKVFHEDAFNIEDLGPDSAADVRISCSTCGKATGWDRRDIEDFRRHADGDYRRYTVTRDGNVDAVRTRWNEMAK